MVDVVATNKRHRSFRLIMSIRLINKASSSVAAVLSRPVGGIPQSRRGPTIISVTAVVPSIIPSTNPSTNPSINSVAAWTPSLSNASVSSIVFPPLIPLVGDNAAAVKGRANVLANQCPAPTDVASRAASGTTIATAVATSIALLFSSITLTRCDTPVKVKEGSGLSIAQNITQIYTGIPSLPSKSASNSLQNQVRKMAQKEKLPSDIVNVILPDVNHLYNNAEKCQDLAGDVTAINHFHERVIDNPEMLDKLKSDWSKLDVEKELKKIRDGASNCAKDEVNQIEYSYERTQYIAKCIRLLQRCIDKRMFNYSMKYYLDKKDRIHDYEDIRSIASGGGRVPAFLPNEEVISSAAEEEKEGMVANKEEEESSPDDSLPFVSDGNNMRRFKPHELYLIGSQTKYDETVHRLTYERHEIATCDTQYGALFVELIQTALSRAYDLVGKGHCTNRSFFAPVFDQFDKESSKASKHCSAMILVNTEPFEDGRVGINADYSLDFCHNCFIPEAKKFRAAKRKSGVKFTHDARWLRFESALGRLREKQNVKVGALFFPNVDLHSKSTDEGEVSADAIRRRWNSITGLGEYAETRYKNPEVWQIESLKKHGIYLDDENYKTLLGKDDKKRRQKILDGQTDKLKANRRAKWGQGKKKKQKTE